MISQLQALEHLPLHEAFQGWFAGNPDVSTIAEYTNMQLVSTEPGFAVIACQPDRRHANPGGTLQGGILTTVADAAMGTAIASTLMENEAFATLELKVNFLRPVRQEMLRFEGKVVHRGSTTALVECDITNEQGKLVARCNSTIMILRGEKAQGR